MKLSKKNRGNNPNGKKRQRAKTLVAVFMAFSISASIVSCTAPSSKKTAENFKYTITKEVASEELMENRPTSPHWFPSELLAWNSSEDKNMKFNQSSVELVNRVDKEKLTAVNDTQSKDREVVAISIMNSSTSGNYSQGGNKFSANTFSYWQYIDKLVYWGGASGEGLIVPPTADVTDAAHKNGVPVLGTVFFPMVEHGGKMEWLDEFLTKDDNGSFPIVDKLIDVANSFGFDGWFINQETQGTDEAKLTAEHAKLMQELIVEFKSKAADKLEIMWYDSMTEEGEMDWQNALTDKNDFFLVGDNKEAIADSMFLNFWWTTKKFADQDLLKASTEKAKELGIDSSKLFAGIDVQSNGVMTPARWDLFENGETSLGLYCPSWTYSSSSSSDEAENKESRLWVNEFGDPSKKTETKDTEWRGVSNYIVEKTVVNSLPFRTNFNMGNGYNFFINGEKVSEMDWNNRSLADVMPTYRWIIANEGNNKLVANMDYSEAYYGGNSIKLKGNLEAGKISNIKLFSADLKVEDKVSFTTTVKVNKEVAFDLVLEFHDGTKEVVKSKDKVEAEKWSTLSYDISKFKDKSIKTISYDISSKENNDDAIINLGNVSVTRADDSKAVTAANAKVDDKIFDEEAMYSGVKLSWDGDKENKGIIYEIFQNNEDGTKTFLGATTQTAYYFNALPRNGESNKTDFEIVPVNKVGERGTSTTVSMEWPDNKIPRANFKVSKTLVAPGEEITFESISSQNTEEITWTFTGANIESSTEKTPKVSYAAEGEYTVKLMAKNKDGQDEKVGEALITVKEGANELVTLSEEKEAEASSFVNNNEAPKFALDGKTDSKWCATGKAPHHITIDLGESKTISEVYMAHAEAGGENPDMNTKDYAIEVSEDGKEFTEVVRIKSNDKGETTDTFKAVNARYVRVKANKPTQNSDSAVRIYEVQVRGLK
ncbi:MAG: endo-beta-N-acetylglucosaminidase [Sarcina sp.]